MMTSDNEQIQMIKDLWKQYGNSVLFALAFFLVVNFGWRYWHQYQSHQTERASIIYTQMSFAFEQHKDEEAKLFAERLLQNHAKTSYAGLAALMLAKNAAQNGDLNQAQEKLQFVIDKTSNNTLRQIARVRAARLLLAKKQPQATLDLLAKIDDDAYEAEISEISGDALLMLGKVTEAQQAYQKVKNIDAAKSPLLQLKMRQF